KVVMNAIAWTAGLEVPPQGIETTTPTDEELSQNLDPKPPRRQPAPRPKAAAAPPAAAVPAKPLASSPILTVNTPGHSAELEADITGAKQLYLVVTDGGDGYGCDWADWINPR